MFSQHLLASSQFGLNPVLFVVQIVNLLALTAYIILIFKASFRVADKGNGIEVPVWLFAIVLLPIIGGLAALSHYKDK